MFSTFTTLLHAEAPALNRRRAYRLEIGRDLFGDWWVEVTFGRIGRAGRAMRFAARDEAQAQKIASVCLARRGSALRRIGVGYKERATFDPLGWGPGIRSPHVHMSPSPHAVKSPPLPA